MIVALEDDVAEALSAEYDQEVRHFVCEIADLARVKSLRSEINRIDVLVNNAGFEFIAPIMDPSERVDDIFRRIVETNVIGTFSVIRHLLDRIPDGNRVVNSASIWGKTAVTGFSAYCASKQTVIQLTRSFAPAFALAV